MGAWGCGVPFQPRCRRVRPLPTPVGHRRPRGAHGVEQGGASAPRMGRGYGMGLGHTRTARPKGGSQPSAGFLFSFFKKILTANKTPFKAFCKHFHKLV
jgi:hypothetical protein